MSIVRRTTTVDGRERAFLLAEPDAGALAPGAGVFLSLHGTRSSADRQARLSRMAAMADSAGAVVAFPEAVVPAGSGYQWDREGDVPFLAGLAEQLVGRYSPPAGRICVAGMSGGARMACHLAATRAELVSAVAAVAGLRFDEGRRPGRPVPVVAFHGTADRINPYDGSGTPRWDESVPEAARRWAVANGVPPEPAEVRVSATLTRTTFGREGETGEVSLWTFGGAGHTWPGTRLGMLIRLFLGRTSFELDATATICAFAARHALGP